MTDDPSSLRQDRELYTTVEDLLRRARALEEEARRNEQRSRSIVEFSLDAVVIMDEDGIARSWNAQAERTFGWSREEAVGRTLADLIIPPGHRPRNPFLIRGEQGRANRRFEMTVLSRDGHEFPAELSITSARSAEGWIVIAFIRDLSAREGSMADSAGRARRYFLANISHEVRTPMTAIIGMTELVLDTELTPEQRECLMAVKEGANSLLNTLDALLEYSEIQKRAVELEGVEFDLRQAINGVVDTFREAAAEKGLTLTCCIDDNVPVRVIGDPGRLARILAILLSNGIKFTGRGKVGVHVATVVTGEADTLLLFSVSDSGMGIAPENLASIFEPLTQEDNSATRRFGGAGMGLAIASRLVELMGGRIWVESDPGKGSTFHFAARFRRS